MHTATPIENLTTLMKAWPDPHVLMQTQPTIVLRAVMEMLAPSVGVLPSDILIAGGACVNLEKAGDIDVYTYSAKPLGCDYISIHSGFDNSFVIRYYPAPSLPYDRNVKLIGEGVLEHHYRNTTLRFKRVQILACQDPLSSCKTLTDTFDIGEHAAAISLTDDWRFGQVPQGGNITIRHENVYRGARTLARAMKLCRRYGLKLSADDYRLLLERLEHENGQEWIDWREIDNELPF